MTGLGITSERRTCRVIKSSEGGAFFGLLILFLCSFLLSLFKPLTSYLQHLQPLTTYRCDSPGAWSSCCSGHFGRTLCSCTEGPRSVFAFVGLIHPGWDSRSCYSTVTTPLQTLFVQHVHSCYWYTNTIDSCNCFCFGVRIRNVMFGYNILDVYM